MVRVHRELGQSGRHEAVGDALDFPTAGAQAPRSLRAVNDTSKTTLCNCHCA
ncbi:hypothetical protein [Streptomyces sp. NPDC012825]|uniref:hypothetical protein n=1 Tax=Streptomyces sp. NPDC012825 TaxID=3364851 RepID=UPI00369B0A29